MKYIFTILIAFTICNHSYGQTCYAGVPANAYNLPNDTVIKATMANISDSYVPCKSLRIDSAITVQNRIYLRPGTSFTTDSLSTLYGGYFIYADSGATVDMNFKAALQLSYTTGAILIDTNSQSNAIFCSILPFNFSNMIQSHSCFPLSIANVNTLNNIGFATMPSYWQINNPNTNDPLHWTLYTLDGKRLKEGDSKEAQLQIDHSNLAQGIYLLQLAQQKQTLIRKLFNN